MTTANIRFAKQRLLAPVYRRAAQKIERGDTAFACLAIEYSSRGVLLDDAIEHFEKLYKVDARAVDGSTIEWMANVALDLPDNRLRRAYVQDCRIVALCFAAAMAETGDLP